MEEILKKVSSVLKLQRVSVFDNFKAETNFGLNVFLFVGGHFDNVGPIPLKLFRLLILFLKNNLKIKSIEKFLTNVFKFVEFIAAKGSL